MKSLFNKIIFFFNVPFYKFLIFFFLSGTFNYFTVQLYLLDTRFQDDFSKVVLSDFFEFFYESTAVLTFHLSILFLFIFLPLCLFSVTWILFRLLMK